MKYQPTMSTFLWFFFSLGTQDQRVILRAEICYDMICYAINLINKAVKWTYSAPIW